MKIRTDVTEKMFNMTLLFVVLILCPITFAEPEPEAYTVTEPEATTDDAGSGYRVQQPCESKCGFEEMYNYDAVNDRCLINFKKVMKRVVVVYGKNNDDEFLPGDEMAKSIYIEGQKLFKGIMISVILFMTCASICAASACMYCCRINYTDRALKNDVKALAKKLNRNYCSKNMDQKRPLLPTVSESCSIVVEPAGVIVA